MPVTASWHSTLAVPTTDPFAEPARIEDVGIPIALDAADGTAELRRELLETVAHEARLADRGIECKIKGTIGASCHACPLFDASDPLCQLGRTQERLVTALKVASLGGRR